MHITAKSLILDITDKLEDCLRVGGVCGRRVAYPLAAAMRVTGMGRRALAAADRWTLVPGRTCANIEEVLAAELGPGRVLRRGVRIA